MKSRYFVAVPVGGVMERALRDFYKAKYGFGLPVRNLHMSLVSPFFLSDGVNESEMVSKLREIKIPSFTARATDWGLFKQKGKRMLYVVVEPKIDCQRLSNLVVERIGRIIQIDTSPFDGGVVPEFEPHITLDYDFKGELPDNFQEVSFEIDRVVIFKGGDGVWEIVDIL